MATLETGGADKASADRLAEEKAAEAERLAAIAAYAPLKAATLAHLFAVGDAAEKASAKASLLALVQEFSLAPVYERLCSRFGWAVDAALLEKLKAANGAEVATLEAKVGEAREKFGEVEVVDAQRAVAECRARHGDKESALKAFDEITSKSLSTGQKIDVVMAKARLAFASDDWPAANAYVADAIALNERGGDWDRRNRLKVYEAVTAMVGRDFARAAALFLDSVATFTATDVFDYTAFVMYTVVTSLKALERPSLKKRVVDSPDIASVIGDVPHLTTLLHAFHEGRYRDFFAALVDFHGTMLRDRYLSAHAPYLLRELRVAAYRQFLDSYKSVTLPNMAAVFGLSTPFLDAELSRFIASGRLNAKIDAVAGVIETTRPDSKNAQYHEVLKQAAVALLNKIQKLARVVAN